MVPFSTMARVCMHRHPFPGTEKLCKRDDHPTSGRQCREDLCPVLRQAEPKRVLQEQQAA